VLTITEAPTWYGALSLEVRSDIEARLIKGSHSVPERIGRRQCASACAAGRKRIERSRLMGKRIPR